MRKTLNTFAAVLLNLLNHGMGHIYLGYYKRGSIILGLFFLNCLAYLFLPPLIFNYSASFFKFTYYFMGIYLIFFVVWVLTDTLILSFRKIDPPNIKSLPNHKVLRFILLFIIATAISVATPLILPSRSVYHYTIPASGMSPTLEQGDYIVAVETSGSYLAELRNAVVTYTDRPDDENGNADSYKILMGRIAAIEGDKLRIDPQTGNLIVNGKEFPLINRGTATYEELKQAHFYNPNDPFVKALWENKEAEVPLGHFFLIQDNYSNGVDSRGKGTLDASRIGEKVSFIYFSKDNSGIRWKRINQNVE